MRYARLLFIALAFSVTALAPPAFAQSPSRDIAITIDDLPAGGANAMTGAEITEMTAKLTAAIRQQKVPAVGFVNERKLYKWGEVDQRIKALAMWVESGLELGNHTFSHISLNQAGLQAFEDDVVQGEPVTRMLLAQHNLKLRYFRHPFLDTGRDLETRRQAEAFLVGRGYRIAPVTVDGWDWMFGGIYDDAKRRNDTALQQQLTGAYLAHTDAVFAYCEQQSKELLGYELKQVLLLHGNWLEADRFGDLAELIRKRGYRFVTLQEALGDQAYGLPDTYVGEEGTSWLDHWAVTRGKPPQGFPQIPEWVLERSRALRQPSGATSPPAP